MSPSCFFHLCLYIFFFFFKQKTAYEMRISDWSSDVCSSDLPRPRDRLHPVVLARPLLAGVQHRRFGHRGRGGGDHAVRAVPAKARDPRLVFASSFLALLPLAGEGGAKRQMRALLDRKSTRLNSSH